MINPGDVISGGILRPLFGGQAALAESNRRAFADYVAVTLFQVQPNDLIGASRCAYCGRPATGQASCPGCGAPPA